MLSNDIKALHAQFTDKQKNTFTKSYDFLNVLFGNDLGYLLNIFLRKQHNANKDFTSQQPFYFTYDDFCNYKKVSRLYYMKLVDKAVETNILIKAGNYGSPQRSFYLINSNVLYQAFDFYKKNFVITKQEGFRGNLSKIKEKCLEFAREKIKNDTFYNSTYMAENNFKNISLNNILYKENNINENNKRDNIKIESLSINSNINGQTEFFNSTAIETYDDIPDFDTNQPKGERDFLNNNFNKAKGGNLLMAIKDDKVVDKDFKTPKSIKIDKAKKEIEYNPSGNLKPSSHTRSLSKNDPDYNTLLEIYPYGNEKQDFNSYIIFSRIKNGGSHLNDGEAVPFENIIKKAEAYAKECEGRDKNFVKGLTNWLNSVDFMDIADNEFDDSNCGTEFRFSRSAILDVYIIIAKFANKVVGKNPNFGAEDFTKEMYIWLKKEIANRCIKNGVKIRTYCGYSYIAELLSNVNACDEYISKFIPYPKRFKSVFRADWGDWQKYELIKERIASEEEK